MPTRDELLVILDLTSTILRAGQGVHELIRAPQIELPTRLGLKRDGTGKVEDYLVGQQLVEAERKPLAERDFDVVHPMRIDERVGLEVVDWVGLEAIFRYALHTSLGLQRPPLANNCVLSVPPSLSPSTVDRLHQLMFERLLVPSLLLSTRPFFAAASAGILSGVVLDIGYRGEGTELSVVHENMIVEGPSGLRLPHVDEGACDDWCALQLLEADPTLPQQFAGAKKASDLGPGELAYALRAVVGELKARDMIGFESPLIGTSGAAVAAGPAIGEEEGSFDIAKAVVEGKVNDIVKKKGKGKAAEEDEGDFVRVPNPFAPPPPAIDLSLGPNDQPAPAPYSTLRIGPARHRYLEPLFLPQLIAGLAPSAGGSAAALALQEYERFAGAERERLLESAGVHEAVGAVLSRVEDLETRGAVSETVVLISSGRIASNKALPAALAPLLTPFRPDPSSAELAAIAAEGGVPPQKGIRVARGSPDYFANFMERAGELAVYLGGCVMGKLLIGDSQSKLFMSKAEYGAHGPAYYRRLDMV
ncbi:hypothetical protein JCM10213_008363 [Rhodosporidiobolus nylandii]